MYYLIIFYVGRHCAQVHHTVLKLSVLYSQTVLKYSIVLNGIIYYMKVQGKNRTLAQFLYFREKRN